VATDDALQALENSVSQRLKTDPDAFVQLYDLYFGRVFNYIRFRIDDPDVCDDLVSEVFERAYTRLHTYRPERGSFASWLFGITRNAANAHLRKTASRPTIALEAAERLAAKGHSPEGIYLQREQLQALQVALKSLDRRQRDVLGLKFAARLTNRRIAELTGLSESNVAVIAYRAIRALQAQLDPWLEQEVDL
jgi:RNA polymerase sigma-70 factor (ECF subfamily)